MQEKKSKKPYKRAATEPTEENEVNIKKQKNKVKKTKVLINESNEDMEPMDTANNDDVELAEETAIEASNSTNKVEAKKQKGKLKNAKQNEETLPANGLKEKSIKNIDTSIFQFFTNLTQANEDERLKAATQLIQQLHRTKEPEKRQKELAYALKRLVRGCGAATNASRAGFFTGLVAFLKTFKSEEIEISNIFDTVHKELHVGATIANKEDADAVVGKILVCGALLRAGRVNDFNGEQLEKFANILLQATKQRTYHASLGYAFLNELIETALTPQQFDEAVWPSLLKELSKPWQKQTLQTVHCLIVVQRKFPEILNAKFLKAHFGGRELVNPESYTHLQRIFWAHSDTHIITHPAFEAFGAYLADCSSLVEFWTKTVDDGIQQPTKLSEYLTLKILTDILNNLKPERTSVVVSELLSTNFMKMLINGLKQIKLKKDETLKAFYDEFVEALVAACVKMPANADVQKVAVIQRLILYPGSFDIEKYTSTRIIHQLMNTLGLEGIKALYEIYQQIFCGTLPKQTGEHTNEEWQHFERLNAGYVLQHLLAHKAAHEQQSDAVEWRVQQLQLLMTCGIFHVQQTGAAGGYEPCKKEAACSFSKDYGEQCKNMFFASLQSKLVNLQQERELLLQLIQMLHKPFQKKNFKQFLRIKLNDKNYELLQAAWQKLIQAVPNENGEKVKKPKKQKDKINQSVVQDKLQLVFHILIMNMGLQLFREVEIAAPAIDDLLKCVERTKQQQQKKKQSKSDTTGESNDGDEPEWIEVVVDLFLHLLSQNVGGIRNSINHLFPHLCGSLNANAIHQILSVLDMKDGLNPLSRKGDDAEESDAEESDESEAENDNSEEEDLNDDSEDEEDMDDEDDDEEDGDEDEEVTANDKLRNAISQALIANGAAVNIANGKVNDDDDDMASVDLNDMTEEEGRRLDEALASAFKALKKPSSGSNATQKSKSKRVETTTVMHFRIRVLDLLEIYLQQPKTDLLNHIEIMLALYNMLQYCWSDELKPLQAKVEKVLQKLTTIKSFGSFAEANDNLKPEDVINYINQIVGQKTPTLAFDLTNKIRNRCIVYLISSATRLCDGDSQVLDLCQQYQSEFLQSRNPIVNVTLLSEIYKLRWSGLWRLAFALVEKGLQMETRAFRRIQVCEILAVLYKNNELQKLDLALTQKSLKKIEKLLLHYIDALKESWSQPQARQSHKEFQTLLDLILNAQRAHVRLQSTVTSLICSAAACDKVQELRKHIRLEAAHIYHRYCGTFKLPVIRNTQVILSDSNAKTSTPPMTKTSEIDEINEVDTKLPNGTDKIKKAKKNQNLDARKLKKQKKLERMLAASKGINGGFGVQKSSAENNESDDDEGE